IQRGTKRKLSEIVANGINQGHATPKIAKAIRDALGPETSKARSLAIARSEVTGALNAGTYEAMKPMLERGVLSGREWATVGDDDVRETHVAMSGVVANGGSPFTVPIAGGGSEPAIYPGHPDLSVGNRVNCRCCVVSILAPPPPKVKPPRVSKPVAKPSRQPAARPVPLPLR
ncbi:MAG: hypothetical protein JNM18_16860, partial [Planctomycetaceae bacterium]|nr:hypothetical protein [Planctomycetaceae bacterium]